MLLAPKSPSTPSTPAAEKDERYSLTQLLNLLQLANRFMDFGKPYLHKLGYHEPAVLYFLQEMNLYLKFHPSQFEAVLVRAQEVLQTIQTSETLKCEIDHVWARLLKLMFMNTNILNLNDMRVNCSRALYVNELKTLLSNTTFTEVYDPAGKKVCQVTKFDRGCAQSTLYEFMGQLLSLGFEAPVKAIHNYLHLAKKVVNSKESGMSAEYVGMTIAPTIHQMLFLDNALCPIQEMKKSLELVKMICTCLLQTSRFDALFDPAVYKEYQQAKYPALYQSLMPTLTDPTRLLGLSTLVGEDPTVSALKKLHVKKQPSPALSTEPCKALVDSLAKKEEEPIVRGAAPARMLTKSAASRTLNANVSADDLTEYRNALQSTSEVEVLPQTTALIFSEVSNTTPQAGSAAPGDNALSDELMPSKNDKRP